MNKTGLEGPYDFKAGWKFELPPDGVSASVDPREEFRPVVFAALENQLGLKLVPQKIAVRMLVIDSVERASKN